MLIKLSISGQKNLSVPGNIILQLVPVNPHYFSLIACLVIKMPLKHVGKLFEETFGSNIFLYAWKSLFQPLMSAKKSSEEPTVFRISREGKKKHLKTQSTSEQLPM
jgi:hypothetical protein